MMAIVIDAHAGFANGGVDRLERGDAMSALVGAALLQLSARLLEMAERGFHMRLVGERAGGGAEPESSDDGETGQGRGGGPCLSSLPLAPFDSVPRDYPSHARIGNRQALPGS